MFLKKRKPAVSTEGGPAEPSPVKGTAAEKGKATRDAAAEKDPLILQISNLEGLVNRRTRDLEEAKRQLVKLHESSVESSVDKEKEDDKDTKVEKLFSQPNQAKEASKLPEQPPAVPPVELKAAISPEKASTDENKDKEKDNQPLDLFSNEEVEYNPLTGLIESMPEVTAKELVEEVKEINTMLHEWQTKQEV